MERPSLIGLTGHYGVGKDTVAEILAPHGYMRVAFADGVREMARAIDPYVETVDEYLRLSEVVDRFGWAYAKSLPDVRRLLQRIGTEGVRNILGEDSWIEAAWKKVVRYPRVVITDARFQNEAAAVKAAGGEIWKITRPGYEGDGHASEAGIDLIQVDQVIANDGTRAELAVRVHWAIGYSAIPGVYL